MPKSSPVRFFCISLYSKYSWGFRDLSLTILSSDLKSVKNSGMGRNRSQNFYLTLKIKQQGAKFCSNKIEKAFSPTSLGMAI